MAAATLAAPAAQFARDQAAAFAADPLQYFIVSSRRVGVGMLVSGSALGVAAYYLKAAATSAMNNELNVLGNIGTIFSNIQAPNISLAAGGTAPLSWSVAGVQNFFSNSWADVQAVGSDIAQIGAAMGTLAEDLATAVIDVGKAILAFVMHFPDILWNGLVWGIGGAIADILTWAFPWLILIGGILTIASAVAYAVRAAFTATVGAAWREAWAVRSATLRERYRVKFDRLLGNSRLAPAPEMEGDKTRGDPGTVGAFGSGSSAETPGVGFETKEGVSPPASESPPTEIVTTTTTSTTETEAELPAGWTKPEMESYLGEAQQQQRDTARAATA